MKSTFQECAVFQKLDPKLSIENLGTSNSIYWCITALRLLHLKDRDPQKYDIVKRMMVIGYMYIYGFIY
jgi:sugar (pentulose or hexulose) kinase